MQCKVTQNMRNTLINRAVIYNNPSLFTACHFAMKTCTWLYILTFIGTPKTQLPVSRLTFDGKIAIFLVFYNAKGRLLQHKRPCLATQTSIFQFASPHSKITFCR